MQFAEALGDDLSIGGVWGSSAETNAQGSNVTRLRPLAGYDLNRMVKKRSRAKASSKKSSPKSRIGTLAQCCAALHLKPRRIQQLANDGLPKTSRGRYNIRACQSWYIRYLHKRLAEIASPDPADASTIAQRHKMLAIDIELKLIGLASERRNLISVGKAGSDLLMIVQEIKNRVLQISPRLATEVVGEMDVVIVTDKIDRRLREVLVQLSKFDPDHG